MIDSVSLFLVFLEDSAWNTATGGFIVGMRHGTAGHCLNSAGVLIIPLRFGLIPGLPVVGMAPSLHPGNIPRYQILHYYQTLLGICSWLYVMRIYKLKTQKIK